MATPEDDTTTQTAPPPPAATPDILAQAQQLAQQFLPAPVQVDTTPVKRSWLSLLGEAVGGGKTIPMSPADEQRAGLRALGDFGTSLMAASHYQPGQTVFSNLAQGFQGAERSMTGSEQMAAGTLAAQQGYQQQQLQNRLEALKQAIPLLRMQQAAGMPNSLLGGGAGGGGIGATGAPITAGDAPVLQRDPSIKVAGDQANNPGNLMYVRGQPGVSGQLPLSGGRTLAAFPDMPTGIAANANQLMLNQDQHGINTVRGMVSRWVGDPKADLGSYTADVSKALGVDPDAPVDFHNPDVLSKFIAAQRPHESGPAALNPADVTKGVGMALAGRTVAPGGGGPPAPYKVAGPTVAPPGGAPAAPTSVTPQSPTIAQATPPTVTPPAQPTPQQPTQGDQPPAPTGPLTIEQYRALHPITLDPSTYTVPPPDVSALVSARNEAARQLSAARAGLGGDPNKSLSDYNTAAKAVTDAQQGAASKSLELQQAARKDAEDRLQQAYNDEMTRQQQAKLKADELAQTVAENEKNRQADIRKAELAAGYTAEQSERQADIDIAKNDITDRTAQAQKSSQIIPVLQQMQGQFGNLPTGFIGGLLAKYDTTGDLTGMLARMGVVDPSKATAAQLLIAARNYLSIETKPAATGSLRLPEMDKLQSFTPGQLDTPQAQQEMIGRLIAYQKRIQDERTFAGNYFGRTDPTTGKRIYDNRGLETAMNAPVQYDQNGVVTGGGLGPVVPEPPPLNRPDAEHQAYLNYIHRNVAPGMPYQSWEPKTNPDGSTVRDARGQPVPQRVTKMQGYQ